MTTYVSNILACIHIGTYIQALLLNFISFQNSSRNNCRLPITRRTILYEVREIKKRNWGKISGLFTDSILQNHSYHFPYLHTAAFVSPIVQSSATAHQPLCCFCLHLINGWKMGSFQYRFHFGEKNLAYMGDVKHWNWFIGKRILDRKGVVSWSMKHKLFFQRFCRVSLTHSLSLVKKPVQ